MRSFLRILLTLTGLFCLTGTQPCRTPPENVMIIRGLAVFAAQPYRSFLKIFRSRVALFPESSAHGSIFFKNCHLATRTFFEILSSVCDHFLELPACDPLFYGKVRVTVRSCRIGKWIQRMGAVAPIPPRARSAASEGASPRRNRNTGLLADYVICLM